MIVGARTAAGSLGKSILTVDDLVKLEYPLVADCMSLVSAVDLYSRSVALGKKPIIGITAYMAIGERASASSYGGSTHFECQLYAKNYNGYQALVRLITEAHRTGFYQVPRIDFDLLQKNSADLVVVMGGLKSLYGLTYKYVKAQNNSEDKPLFELWGSITRAYSVAFDFFFLVDTTKRCDPDDVDFHWLTRNYMMALRPEMIVRGGEYNCHTEKDKYTLVMLSRLVNNITIQTPHDVDYCEVDFESEDNEGFLSLVAGKAELNRREPQLPSSGVSRDQFGLVLVKRLEELNLAGSFRHIERLSYEVDTISRMGYIDYFMLVKDIIDYCNASLSGYWSAGRGSVGGSLVAYLLGITRIDPVTPRGLDIEIPFSRFLNAGRRVMPDIDMDFLPGDRDLIIDYLKIKYGRNRVFNIGTVMTFGPRAALRELARINDMLNVDLENIIKAFPKDQHLTLALVKESELYKNYENWTEFTYLFSLAETLEGIPKAYGVHASGVAITQDDIGDYVPITIKDGYDGVLQYGQDALDYLGVVKLDILGLNTLKNVADAVRKYNAPVDFRNNPVPLDDPEVYWLINSGHTAGVFQWDTHNYKKVIEALKPTKFSELVDLNSLGRSAALLSGLTDSYIARKNGTEPIQPIHPKLAGLMKETYELPLYQEQIMLLFSKIAGYSDVEADDVRRAIGKKLPELMEEQRVRFKERAMSISNLTEQEVEDIWQKIEKFSKYTWNLGHAAAYTLICYETAYLAAKHPAEYYCACINNENKQELKHAFMSAAIERGISIEPPLVNKSFVGMTLDSGKILIGLSAVKFLGDRGIAKIQSERYNKDFKSAADFVLRCRGKDLNITAIKALYCAGAFRDFPDGGDVDWFAGLFKMEVDQLRMMVVDQYNISGIIGHPIKTLRVFDGCNELSEIKNKEVITTIVYINDLREFYTRSSGQAMAFVKIAYDFSVYDAIIFPSQWADIKSAIVKNRPSKVRLKYDTKKHTFVIVGAERILDAA